MVLKLPQVTFNQAAPHAPSRCSELVTLTTASTVSRNMPEFLESSRRHGLSPIVMGLGAEWFGLGIKVRLIHQFVRTMKREQVVLFADAWDSLVVKAAGTILEKFRSLRHPLVFSAERNCWPRADLEALYPHAPTPYRFLNSGGWIGEAGYVADLLQRWGAERITASERSDQEWWSERFIAEPAAIHLDVYCKLFQCMEVGEDHLENRGGIYNRVTGEYPSVIHALGRQDVSHLQQWSAAS